VTAARNEVLLAIRDLTVRYRTAGGQWLTAVNSVSLDIAPGRVFALVGESGAGKSSVANAVLQLTPAASGSIRFRGEDLGTAGPGRMREARRAIQYVFQDPLASLSPRRTVLQTLREPLDHFRIGEPGQREQRATAALETVGLDPDLGHRYPQALSGGQRQRVALARALVTEPELIIADEPLSSLDVSVRSRILDLMRRLRDELGLAFLFVSHDLSVVRQLADTVAVMYLGRVVERGPAGRVLDQPAHPYTRSLLRAVPVPDPDHAPPEALDGEPPSPLTPPSGCVFHKRCRERLDACSRQRPQETLLDEATAPAESREGPEHRVMCHLWRKPVQ
jgi:peptide/nickel transport system ATP-binding protein/oligopeptide transport system ATP-binding protein